MRHRSASPIRSSMSVFVTIDRTRPAPRWLALLKERPMYLSSRVTVGSPTLRLTLAIVVTTALLLGVVAAVVAGASLPPSPAVIASGPTIVFDWNDRQKDDGWIGIVGPSDPQRVLFPDLLGAGYATWSLDGSEVVYSKAGIFARPVDGRTVESSPLTVDCTPPTCVEEMSLVYSSDGSHAVAERFMGDDANPTGTAIAVTDYATGKATMLTQSDWSAGENKRPRWSPDGTRIVFYRTERSADFLTTGSGVWVVNVDGTGLQRLTPEGTMFGDPDWSPDGTLIVMDSGPTDEFPNGSQDLYTIHPDGSGLTQITTHTPGTGSAAPRWTPDGKAIVYTALHGIDGELFAMPIAGGPPIRITQPEPGYQHVFAAFKPGSGSLDLTGAPSQAP